MPYLVAQSCLTLCAPIDCSPPGFSVHGISQDKNTGIGWHFLFQGIFLTQGSTPCLLSSALQADHLTGGSPINSKCQLEKKNSIYYYFYLLKSISKIYVTV